MNKQRLSYISTILLITFLLGTVIGQAQTPTVTTWLQPGSLTENADSTLWVDGSNYFSKNGTTGQISTNTNATAIIQNALDVGGHIYLKAGDYYTTQDLDVTVDYTFIDGDPETRILCSSQNYGFLVSADYVTINRVWVNGTGTMGVNGFGITFDYGCSGGVVSNCKVTQTGLDGIHLRNCQNTTITNCIVENTNDDCIASLFGNDNIITNNHVSQGNTVTTNRVRGIVVGGDNGTIVMGNTVENINGVGILIMDFTNQSLNIVVVGNNVRNTGKIAQAGYEGAGIYLQGVEGATITGNTVNEAYWSGVHLYNTSYSTITGNSIKDCGKNATGWQGGIVLEYYSTYNVITGNIICDALGGLEYGIVETGGGTNDFNVFVSNSAFDATTLGISLDGANSKVNLCYNGTAWLP